MLGTFATSLASADDAALNFWMSWGSDTMQWKHLGGARNGKLQLYMRIYIYHIFIYIYYITSLNFSWNITCWNPSPWSLALAGSLDLPLTLTPTSGEATGGRVGGVCGVVKLACLGACIDEACCFNLSKRALAAWAKVMVKHDMIRVNLKYIYKQ